MKFVTLVFRLLVKIKHCNMTSTMLDITGITTLDNKLHTIELCHMWGPCIYHVVVYSVQYSCYFIITASFLFTHIDLPTLDPMALSTCVSYRYTVSLAGELCRIAAYSNRYFRCS